MTEKETLPIEKGRNHKKNIGDFGEALVCNWLSRSGFDVAIFDYIGIDILAYHPKTKKRLGISVKSRTRAKGKENSAFKVFSKKKDRQNTIEICEAFDAKPWIAIYAEYSECADLYLLSLEHYDKEYRSKPIRTIDTWRMSEEYRKKYHNDCEVRHIEMNFFGHSWHWS